VQTQGQKKLLEEINTSMKQILQVPTGFNGMGIQLELFTVASEIFFGKESVYTASLRRLLIIVGHKNKKIFFRQITLDDLFVAKYLPAINHRFQSWFSMYEGTTILQSPIDNRVLQFDNIIKDICRYRFS
jgi:hypothetical protein